LRRPRASASPPLDAALLGCLVVAAVLIAYKVRAEVSYGPGWDAYAFLANAATWAGRGYGYSEAHRPPLLSILTSLPMRLGFVQASVIQVVDGVLSLSGIAAAYLLFRRAVSQVPAAIGALALLAVTPFWDTVGIGYTDIAAVAICMWALLALIRATETNDRWYLVGMPLLVLAVLMRFTALLFFFPAGLWLAFRALPIRQARRFAQGAGLSMLAYGPAALFYNQRFGDILFPFVVALTVVDNTSTTGKTIQGASGPAAGWYIRELPGFIGSRPTWFLGAMALGVAGCGLLWTLWTVYTRVRLKQWVTLILCVAFASIAVARGGLFVRQIAIPLAVYVVWRALMPREDGAFPLNRTHPEFALAGVALAWLLAYFDFHGHQTIQEPRYFITMAPPLMYLLLLGWRAAFTIMQSRMETFVTALRRPVELPSISRIGWIALLGVVAVTLSMDVATMRGAPDPETAAARSSALWITQRAGSTNPVVYSDVWPMTSWYMRRPVREMPAFADPRGFAHELEKSDVDYFVTYRQHRDANFKSVPFGAALTLLERTSPPAHRLPRILLLGTKWDKYFEPVDDYRVNLYSFAGRYGWEDSVFADWQNAGYLGRYPAVAAFAIRWRDRLAAEDILRTYVERGGVLFLDASSNLDGKAYNLGNEVLLDTMVQRTVFGRKDTLQVAPSFAQRYPKLAHLESGPFVDETGGAWVGATYVAMTGHSHEVLARLGGRPVVTTQRIGKGRVYWMGANLLWHAFESKSTGERELIRAIIADGLSAPRKVARRD